MPRSINVPDNVKEKEQSFRLCRIICVSLHLRIGTIDRIETDGTGAARKESICTDKQQELTGNISTAPLRGFFERTVPVTLGVVDDAFTFGTVTVEVIFYSCCVLIDCSGLNLYMCVYEI